MANTDNIEQWGIVAKEAESADKETLFELAERQWIERMIRNHMLLIHLDAKAELIARDYKPLAKHRKMIWASILVNYDEADSRARFNRIKEKIIKKHSSIWWRDVYNKIKPTYAIKKRLEETTFGPAVAFAASHSSFLGNVVAESRDDILRKLPNE